MQGTRRIEMNPGEFFAVSDRVILVAENESVLGRTGKLGAPAEEDRLTYFFTFTGKLNNRDEHDSVTVAMSPEDAFEFASQILDGIQLLLDAQKEA